MASKNKEVTEKQKALSMVLNQIERNFGKGSIMRLGEASRMQVAHYPHRSTDARFRPWVGGIPKGRIIEIYGPESFR